MKYKYVEESIDYTGAQLTSHFAYANFGIPGDSIIAFCGGCEIPPEYMVDIEDVRDNSRISSELMLHFIIEHHETDLGKIILRQIIFAVLVQEEINKHQGSRVVERRGSDIYDQDAKVSISVATVTPMTSLIHFGVNISSRNAPVKVKGLEDYNIIPREFAECVMKRYLEEYDHCERARYKVKWVR